MFIWNTWKYWWNESDKEICVYLISMKFESYFLDFQWEIVFFVCVLFLANNFNTCKSEYFEK